MSIQWMTETTFQLPWLTKFLGYKLHAENAAKWVEDYYKSAEGQQFLTERNLPLTLELQAEDTVRDLEMLIDALRKPIAQLTLFGYNVTHAVFSMAPPHYITVIDFAKYTTHDYHTPEQIDSSDVHQPSVWEQVFGYSWSEADPMLPSGAGTVVALLMDERRNLHQPGNMATDSYAYELLAASDPSLKVTFRQTAPYHPSRAQVFLWDMAVPSTFRAAMQALKPRIESLRTILETLHQPFYRPSGEVLTQKGMWWIVQPDLEPDPEEGKPRPALNDKPTAWSCTYELNPWERALLGYCRLNAVALRHGTVNVLEPLLQWIMIIWGEEQNLLDSQAPTMDHAGQYVDEYSDADVRQFIHDYHIFLTPLDECLNRIYLYRYGREPDPATFKNCYTLLWIELLMLLHNLGLIDMLGCTRVVDPPLPLEHSTLGLTGFYEHDEEDLFSPTMMMRHAGRYMEGKLALRFGDTSGLSRFAVYTFTSDNAEETDDFDMQAKISCELAADSDADSTGLDSSFVTDCVVRLDQAVGDIIIELSIPGTNDTYRLAKWSDAAYLDEEEISEQFTDILDYRAALAVHHVTPNAAEHNEAMWAAYWLMDFIYYAFISGDSSSAIISWNKALERMNPFVTFNDEGVTMSGQSMQFPWFQSVVRRILQGTLLSDESVGIHPQGTSIWYLLINKLRSPFQVPDAIRPIVENLDDLLGITTIDLETFPSSTTNHYEWIIHGHSLSRGFGNLFEPLAKSPKGLTRGYGIGLYSITINEPNPSEAAQFLWPAYYYGLSLGVDARAEVHFIRYEPPTWTAKYSRRSSRHLYTHYHWTPNDFVTIIPFELPVELRLLVVELSAFKMGAALFLGHRKETGLSYYSSTLSLADTTLQRVGGRVRVKAEAIDLYRRGFDPPPIGDAYPNFPSYLAQLNQDTSFQLTVSFADGKTELSDPTKQTVREFVARHRLVFETVTMVMEIKGYGTSSEPVTTGIQRAQAVYDFFYTLLGIDLTIWTQNTILLTGDMTSPSAVERTVTVRLANSIGPAQPEAD